MNQPPAAPQEYKKKTISRVYPHVNKDIDSETQIGADFEIEFMDINRLEIVAPVGSGKYSIVFLGRMDGNKRCAIKTLKNVPFAKIQKEIFLLYKVAQIPNCVNIYGVVKDELSETYSIITDYIPTETPKSLFPRLNLFDVRILMYRLLECLDATHKMGIMHRDIKPGNMLFHKNHKEIELIDWGLADYYFASKSYSVRVSTLRYKAPELLLNYQYYDYGIDIWGAGCVLAEMLIKFPFFDGRDFDEMVCCIAKVCGSKSIYKYVDKYGLLMTEKMKTKMPNVDKPQWTNIMKNSSIQQSKNDPDAFNLLSQLLTVDHECRISASEALKHKFFDPVRNLI